MFINDGYYKVLPIDQTIIYMEYYYWLEMTNIIRLKRAFIILNILGTFYCFVCFHIFHKLYLIFLFFFSIFLLSLVILISTRNTVV